MSLALVVIWWMTEGQGHCVWFSLVKAGWSHCCKFHTALSMVLLFWQHKRYPVYKN